MFLVRWLSLHPRTDEIAFFETLLNLEREAMLTGRRDTFFLVQDPSLPWWIEQRQAVYDQARRDPTLVSPAPIRVASVRFLDQGTRAQVTLLPSAGLVERVAYFGLRNEDWKRIPPPDALGLGPGVNDLLVSAAWPGFDIPMGRMA